MDVCEGGNLNSREACVHWLQSLILRIWCGTSLLNPTHSERLLQRRDASLIIISVHTRCIVKTSGFTRGVC